MSETKLGWPFWIGLVVQDLEAQRTFYRDVLGLKELKSGEDWVWFNMGTDNILELKTAGESPTDGAETPATAGGGFRIGFTVEDIEAARAELIARGAGIEGEIEGGGEWGGLWAYFDDPEGNTIALTQKVEASEAAEAATDEDKES